MKELTWRCKWWNGGGNVLRVDGDEKGGGKIPHRWIDGHLIYAPPKMTRGPHKPSVSINWLRENRMRFVWFLVCFCLHDHRNGPRCLRVRMHVRSVFPKYLRLCEVQLHGRICVREGQRLESAALVGLCATSIETIQFSIKSSFAENPR